MALLLLAALAIVRLGPLALEDVFGDSGAIAILGFVLRWALAGALLFVIVGLIARAGPDIERPVRWISFGSGLTVAGWVVTTLVFGLYLSQFASFGSVYGALLATFLLVEYLYLGDRLSRWSRDRPARPGGIRYPRAVSGRPRLTRGPDSSAG